MPCLRPAKTNTFSFAGLELRSVTIDGKPWFFARDVCAFTLHGNVTMALRTLDAAEKAQFNLGHRLMNLISEAGLYRLVMRARKRNPSLQEFQSWVTGTVLPAIRQDGMYVQGEEKLDPNCQTASERDPGSAFNRDPFLGVARGP